VPEEVASTRLSVTELSDTLPRGWNVSETHQYEYRYLFEEDETENTTWTHPDPNCDASLWTATPQSPPVDYKPESRPCHTPEVPLMIPRLPLLSMQERESAFQRTPELSQSVRIWRKLYATLISPTRVEICGSMLFVSTKRI
jgi:hypothetical protein